jgi:hypothetical protein
MYAEIAIGERTELIMLQSKSGLQIVCVCVENYVLSETDMK